jgi:hypothetical protein
MMPDVAAVRERRATDPGGMRDAVRGRLRGSLATPDGRLLIIAADHPARGALGVGPDELAMGDRIQLLGRLADALAVPGVDGVLGTPDVIDDLAALGLLEGKVVVGSMNRGGLRGASFELDDRFTAHDIATMVEDRFDMAKLLLRIDLEDAATADVLENSARAVAEAVHAQLPILIEPFLSTRHEGRVVNRLDPDSVIRSVAIASGLGPSSTYSWLKLPVVREMERVLAATTLPTLILGGDRTSRTDETFSSWEATLALPGVRGVVAGRTLLYPEGDDVRAAVAVAARLVHPRAAGRV